MAKTVIDWDTMPLGRFSDEELAARLGVSRQAVQKQRRARRIEACGAPATSKHVPLSRLEREELALLERAIVELVDPDRKHLSAAAATTIACVPGWDCEVQRPLRAHGRGRATAYRFRLPNARAATTWMRPDEARRWLVGIAGWVDAATKRVDELRRRSGKGDAGAMGASA
jgi:biotin operon repressor